MKILRLFAIVSVCFLLIGCGTTQEKVGESPEEIKQALREGKLIKPGDWVRATTQDDQTHEFSFVGITEDDLLGGDAIVPLPHIKQLEIFPLLRRGDVVAKPFSLVSEDSFESRLAAHIANGIWNFRILMSDGIIYGVESSALENGELIVDLKQKQHTEEGYEKIVSDQFIDAIEKTTVGVTDSGILVSNILRVDVFVCRTKNIIGRGRNCYIDDSFRRWGKSDDLKMEVIRDQTVLKPGDWVRVSLAGEVVQEFQYRELSGKTLVGGDGSVSVADIKSIVIYPTNSFAPTKEQVAGTTAGVVALVGFTILLWGMGIPVPPMAP